MNGIEQLLQKAKILFLAIAVTGVLFFSLGLFFNLGIGIFFGAIVWGSGFLFLAKCFIEVKDPDKAILFYKGKNKGIVDSGWYLITPFSMEIRPVPMDLKNIDLQADTYTSDGIDIRVEASLTYGADSKIFSEDNAENTKLETFLRMDETEMRIRAEKAGLKVLREVVGKKTFEELIKEKEDLEKDLKASLKAEFEEHGRELTDCDIFNYDEIVKSQAKKIEIIGMARGKAAAALADGLKNNSQAAAVDGVRIFMEGLNEVAATLSGKTAKKEKTESSAVQTATPEEELSPQELTNLISMAKKFLRR